ncbi:MAG: endonuclease/exonuclease/phosphatase family protein [Deltaproteobacteria bacterium]|nr:endonuclease/exonuclease/phosphatase family protein [Deltaproteobacteria bacterium]
MAKPRPFLFLRIETNLFSILNIFLLLVGLTSQASASTDDLRAMSFNLQTRLSPFEVGPWATRKQMIADLLRRERVDVLATQEATRSMIDDLNHLLPEFSWVGVGRDDGADGGEFNAIFYRRDRLSLKQSGTFWLAPDANTPGAKGWDAVLPRIATWAKFTAVTSGKEFEVLNTHFDHIGSQAREESARLLLGRFGWRLRDAILILGDFNSQPGSSPYTLLSSLAPDLRDARTTVAPEGPSWTFPTLGPPQQQIDFVFVSNALLVSRYRHIEEDRGAPHPRSDHLPILVEFNWR